MQFTETEARYLNCLAKEMTFAEIAVELGMTVEEVDAFGTTLFDRIFEERRRSIM
jgi:DNA-binding CsgD family transcriptional regulator